MRLCYNVYIVMAPHIMLAHPTKSPLRQPTPRRNHRITATPHPLSRLYPPPTPADPPQPVTKPRQATPGASICNLRQYFAPVCNRQERNSPWIQSSGSSSLTRPGWRLTQAAPRGGGCPSRPCGALAALRLTHICRTMHSYKLLQRQRKLKMLRLQKTAD